jgi:glycosyltransferase involved in cell wall biosynthesis
MSEGISVIVRSCGSEKLLARALTSIRAQTRQPTEVIVVSLGSAGVAALANASVSGLNLHEVRVGEDRKRGAALNDGLRVAAGEWIAFLDDDDTWRPTFVDSLYTAAQPDSGDVRFGGVVCRTEAVYELLRKDYPIESGREPFNPTLEHISPEELFTGNRFTINGALWHRRVFDTLQGFREDLPVLEDWEFNMRVALAFSIRVLPLTLALYHQRPPGDPAPNSSASEHDRVARVLQTEWYRAGHPGARATSRARGYLARLRQRLGRLRSAARWRLR